jgi:hypothetical protein
MNPMPSPDLPAHAVAPALSPDALDAFDRALLRGLAYADLHDYPLTTDEVIALAAPEPGVTRAATERPIVARTDARLHALASVGWLHGDSTAWALRAEVAHDGARRRADALTKTRQLIARHEALVRVFRATPFVRFIGLSGDAAFGWSRAADADVDLFILSAPGRLWTATLAVKLLLRLTGKSPAHVPVFAGCAVACGTGIALSRQPITSPP